MQYLVTEDMFSSLLCLAGAVKSVLYEKEGKVHVDVNKSLGSTVRIVFYSLEGKETSLKMKYFAPHNTLTIQSVLLTNRHHGIFTEILNIIKGWAISHGGMKIIIESVLSIEMSKCALKNGFKIDENSGQYIEVGSFYDETTPKQLIFAGNYVYDCVQNEEEIS